MKQNYTFSLHLAVNLSTKDEYCTHSQLIPHQCFDTYFNDLLER